VRIVLMTSAGSRGLDFPKVSRYVINVNHFAPESTLLEVQQVLFRGRGGGCDGLDREVWFTLSDVLSEDILLASPVNRERRFRRFLFERLSMLVLLRATLLTRASGRAWMPRRNDRRQTTDTVLCPLGETGQSEQEIPIIALFQNTIKAVDTLAQNGLLDYAQKRSFRQRFLSVFPQPSGLVYLDHRDPLQTAWLDHPVQGVLDKRIRSILVERTGAHPLSTQAAKKTAESFLLDRPLVSQNSPRSLLLHQKGQAKSFAWIRGFLCILEVDRARFKVAFDQSRAEEREELLRLVLAFLKRAQESGLERIADHLPTLRDFASFLDHKRLPDDANDLEDYGKDPGKILIITPLTPPWLQSDPDSYPEEPDDNPWTQTLLLASGILDGRDKRRWPMVDLLAAALPDL
jgi:hypothetical protein